MQVPFGRITVALAALALALPRMASAHGVLSASSPRANAVLAAPPAELRLTFTEMPERTFTRIRLFGPDGVVALNPLEVLPGKVAVAGIPARLAAGGYRVEWLTAGADGHPVSGSFTFTVAPLAAAVADVPSHSVSAEHAGMAEAAEPNPFAAFGAILRWITLLGTIAAIGAVAFRATVIARVSLEVDREIKTEYLPSASRGAAMIGLSASLLVLLTAVGRLIFQSLEMHGAADTFNPALLRPMLVDTNWGRAWMIHAVAAVVAVGAFAASRRGRREAWYVAGVATAAVAVGLALASHAAVVPRLSGASVIANVIHTIAAAGWLGNLLVVFAVGLPLAWKLDRGDRWTVIRDIVNAFSPAALASGAVAGATGVFMAWTHVGSIGALTGTDYGRILLLKIGLLSVTGMTGAYNWLRVRPVLGDHVSARRLRRTAGVELGIAALVLAVTAVLVAVPTPQQ